MTKRKTKWSGFPNRSETESTQLAFPTHFPQKGEKRNLFKKKQSRKREKICWGKCRPLTINKRRDKKFQCRKYPPLVLVKLVYFLFYPVEINRKICLSSPSPPASSHTINWSIILLALPPGVAVVHNVKIFNLYSKGLSA